MKAYRVVCLGVFSLSGCVIGLRAGPDVTLTRSTLVAGGSASYSAGFGDGEDAVLTVMTGGLGTSVKDNSLFGHIAAGLEGKYNFGVEPDFTHFGLRGGVLIGGNFHQNEGSLQLMFRAGPGFILSKNKSETLLLSLEATAGIEAGAFQGTVAPILGLSLTFGGDSVIIDHLPLGS